MLSKFNLTSLSCLFTPVSTVFNFLFTFHDSTTVPSCMIEGICTSKCKAGEYYS